jgi:hypothetical protein
MSTAAVVHNIKTTAVLIDNCKGLEKIWTLLNKYMHVLNMTNAPWKRYSLEGNFQHNVNAMICIPIPI